MGGGGFAVSAGDADEPQFPGRVAPVSGGKQRHRQPGIRHGDFPRQSRFSLGHYGGSAPPQYLGGIGVAVMVRPPDTDKNLILYVPAAVADGFRLRRQRLQQSFALNLPVGSVRHGVLLWDVMVMLPVLRC